MASTESSSITTRTKTHLGLWSETISLSTAWPSGARHLAGDFLGSSNMRTNRAVTYIMLPKVTPWKSYTHGSQNRPDTNTPWLTCRVETIAILPTTSWRLERRAKAYMLRPVRATTRPLCPLFHRRNHSGEQDLWPDTCHTSYPAPLCDRFGWGANQEHPMTKNGVAMPSLPRNLLVLQPVIH